MSNKKQDDELKVLKSCMEEVGFKCSESKGKIVVKLEKGENKVVFTLKRNKSDAIVASIVGMGQKKYGLNPPLAIILFNRIKMEHFPTEIKKLLCK